MVLTPALQQIKEATLASWPEHRSFIEKSIDSRSDECLSTSEELSAAILQIVGPELPAYCDDYRKTCEQLTEEEWFFRRNDRYRFARYQEVADFVYHNEGYMQSYVRGLLLSQVLWRNHAETMHSYTSSFLPRTNANGLHLEIGPGHGLSMHLAMRHLPEARFVGWDISETSLKETASCLAALSHSESRFELHATDASHPDSSLLTSLFDSITISEVLEHTEQPREILESLANLLTDDGRVFVNIPVNSPAVDHIYLFESPEQVWELAEGSGFSIDAHHEYPLTGYSEERARKLKATISCVMTLTKA